jgi:peptide/nickel transport system substrate-binding protein
MTTLRKTLLCSVALGFLAGSASAEILRWGAARDIVSLDPYSYGDSFTIGFLDHVYDGLVRYNEEFEIVPALATEWEIVDETTWRFTLRDGVTFHNGAPLTAEDVLASLERVSHPNSPLRGNLPAYQSAEIIDDLTIEMTVDANYPLLLNDLTNIHIFNAQWLTDNDALEPTDVGAGIEGFPTFNANGTGPFRVVEWVPDSNVTLEVNEDWWDEARHNLTGIEFTPISSAATRVAALLSGSIDFTENAPLQDLARLEASPDVDPVVTQDLRTVMFGFNRRDTLSEGQENMFNDLRVRQAFAHAIDAESIRDVIMQGNSRVTGALVAPEIPGYTDEMGEPRAFDPETASALLEDAGATGFSFTLNCMNNGYVNEEELCNAVVPMLNRVGFDVTLDIAERAQQTPKRTSGSADVWSFGWANLPMLDSYSILVQVLHSNEGNAGVFNWGDWSYPEIDALIQSAAVELDFDTRIAMQTEALQIARDELIFSPLHEQPMAWAASSRVVDILQQGDNKPRHWTTRLAD